MKNFSTKQPALKTLEDVNGILKDIAVLTITAENKENAMNKKIIDIKNQYEADVIAIRNKIQEYEANIAMYLKTNKKDFSNVRSKTLTFGRIGFRSGKNRLVPLNKKFNLEYIKSKFQDLFANKYVVVKLKFNKSKAIADAEKGLITPEQLAAAGAKLTKSDSTFYEIFRDQIQVENLD